MLQEQVREAIRDGQTLRVVGGGTKAFITPHGVDAELRMAAHRGIVAYEPSELVITARCGTPLQDVERALTGQDQMLGFEPPHFGTTATVGGVVACGFSGPRRPYAGAVRDFVLGCRLLNGRGEIASFGGTVMKNVAGFDIARVMAGAFGTLGALLEVSLKLVPRPRAELTLSYELDADPALGRMREWARSGLPVSAMSYDNRLRVRLSGAETALRAAHRRLGGEIDADGDDYWVALREHRLPFFAGPETLWRVSVPPAASRFEIPGRCLFDWGGGLRWLKTDTPVVDVLTIARDAGGHAMPFRGGSGIEPLHSLDGALLALHRRVKQAFDPHGVFNVGYLFKES